MTNANGNPNVSCAFPVPSPAFYFPGNFVDSRTATPPTSPCPCNCLSLFARCHYQRLPLLLTLLQLQPLSLSQLEHFNYALMAHNSLLPISTSLPPSLRPGELHWQRSDSLHLHSSPLLSPHHPQLWLFFGIAICLSICPARCLQVNLHCAAAGQTLWLQLQGIWPAICGRSWT